MKRLVFAAITALCLPGAMAQNKGLDLLNSFLGQAGGLQGATQSAPTAQPSKAEVAAGLLGQLVQSQAQVDEPQEIEIGRQLAAVLLGSKPLLGDPAVQRYVNRLGRWIALQSARPELPWAFAVLDDPGFNAFAAPGGYVFVTRGLIERVDEAELAGILAHEVIHVTERHHLEALRSKAGAGFLTQLIGSQVRTRNAVGSMLSQQLLSFGRDLYASGLDQADEFKADREGVALAARAGFDPYGLPTVLERLREQSPDDALFALALSTHPPAQQRLDLLGESMGRRLDALSGKPSVAIAQRLPTKRRR